MRDNNKSSYPVQMVVRASQKVKNKNTKKISKLKSKYIDVLLVSPLQYYARELKRFHPGKTQATGLCPFHQDRHPSFSVNLKTGAYICFACGASGGCMIIFHMKKYGLSREESFKALGVGHE